MADNKQNEEIDERFARIHQDPRFRTLRKKDKILKIDKRFKSMFTDDKFTLKYSMDKRGRAKKHLIAEDYKNFYRLGDDQNNENDAQKEEEKNESDVDDVADKPKLAHSFGYHRGFKIKSKDDDDDNDDEEDETSSSSSSSSESEDENDDNDEELEHCWGELDKDAEQIDHATSRIAICNADWDRMNAQDLYLLLNSFKKTTGTIHSVKIYYSKFGEERIQVEQEKGPSEFIFGKGKAIIDFDDANNDVDNEQRSDDNEDDDDDEKIKDPNTVEKLRKYQLERLKYFYAVVECDSAETAETIYNELDGLEYESSSTMLDIRFIPDDMNFDDVRLKEECTTMPTISSYKAPTFTNTALQQSNVKITWDETDPRRKETFNKAFEEDNENDIKTYLASSSSEDDDEDDIVNDIDVDENMKENDKINKYRDLLSALDKENEKKDFDLEISWDPKFNQNVNEPIAQKSKNDSEDLIESNSEDFTTKEKSKNKKKKQQSKNKQNFIEEEMNDNDKNDLELLMMDVNDDLNHQNQRRKHFNYKDIIEDKYDKDENEDGFKFNPDDDRFNSIYESHLYNIDQSDPQFKRTKAYEQILSKQKQKAKRMVENESEFMDKFMAKQSKDDSKQKNNISNLINKIKINKNKKFRN